MTHLPQEGKMMKKSLFVSGMLAMALVFGFSLAGCATIPTEPTVLEGYWRFTTTTGDAEGQAAVDAAMENVGQFFVFVGNEYYKGMGVLPHEKGRFVIEGNNIVLNPTHSNTGIMANKVSWSKIGLVMKMAYPEKALPYVLSGDLLKVVDIGIQQAFRKVAPFFRFEKNKIVFNIT
jgi:hypothetical protein